MATRPWVQPQEVRDYTENPKVVSRADDRLKMDILRAESYVVRYTGNSFEDAAKYPDIPESVRLAVILLAEMYAASSVEIDKGSYKSESFDDYSYTLSDTASKQENIDLGPLLDEYAVSTTRSAINMNLRKL